MIAMPAADSSISTGYSGRRSSPAERAKKSGAIRIAAADARKITTLANPAKASARISPPNAAPPPVAGPSNATPAPANTATAAQDTSRVDA